jgi:hypothetical protein
MHTPLEPITDETLPIHHLLLRYCEREQITFTRCRPYKKNDVCGRPLGRIEQKNYSIVRQIVGYDRYEGEEAYGALVPIYLPVRHYTNYFQPSVRLVRKQREGAKVTKRYDVAQTPYQRILATKEVADEVKARLHEEYRRLNPAAIRRHIEAAQDALWRRARVRITHEATALSE